MSRSTKGNAGERRAAGGGKPAAEGLDEKEKKKRLFAGFHEKKILLLPLYLLQCDVITRSPRYRRGPA